MNKDKIKKSLAVCVGASCEGCAYVGIHDCCDKLKLDACALITEQEKYQFVMNGKTILILSMTGL